MPGHFPVFIKKERPVTASIYNQMKFIANLLQPGQMPEKTRWAGIKIHTKKR
jgi:hypothetical protein